MFSLRVFYRSFYSFQQFYNCCLFIFLMYNITFLSTCFFFSFLLLVLILLKELFIFLVFCYFDLLHIFLFLIHYRRYLLLQPTLFLLLLFPPFSFLDILFRYFYELNFNISLFVFLHFFLFSLFHNDKAKTLKHTDSNMRQYTMFAKNLISFSI